MLWKNTLSVKLQLETKEENVPMEEDAPTEETSSEELPVEPSSEETSMEEPPAEEASMETLSTEEAGNEEENFLKKSQAETVADETTKTATEKLLRS